MDYDFEQLNLFANYRFENNTIKREIDNLEVFNIFKDINKSIEDISKDINQNLYFKVIYNISINNKIISEFDIFENTGASIYWINYYIDNLTNKINSFKSKIDNNSNVLKDYYYEIKENKEDFEFDSKLKNISLIINNPNNIKYLDKITKDLYLFKDIMLELESSIKKCSKNLKEKEPNTSSIKIKGVEINKESEFDSLVSFQLKYKNKIKLFNNSEYVDIKPLKKIINDIRNELKDIHNIYLKKEIFLNINDSLCNKIKLMNNNEIDDLFNKNENENKYGIKGSVSVNKYGLNGTILKRNEEIISIYDHIDAIDIIKDEYNLIMKKTFHKNPEIVKYFNNKKDVIMVNDRLFDSHNFRNLIDIISNSLNKKQILDNYKFDIIKEFENLYVTELKESKIKEDRLSSFKLFEKFEDKISAILRKHDINNFAKSILSNKYKHLYNEKGEEIIGEIFDLKLGNGVFQQYIGAKIAKHKTPEEFNEALSLFLKSFNSFSMSSILNRADDLNIKVVEENINDGFLVLHIENYEQMEKIGSQSWCITNSERYFNSYTEDSSTQYIYYNFNLEQTNKQSMIGLTYNKNGEFDVGFFKDDSEVEEINDIYVANEIIENYIFDINKTSKLKIIIL